MKRFALLAVMTFTIGSLSAQKSENININKKNSWFKAGLTAGFPVGDISDASSFRLGADLRAQNMLTPNVGMGIATGYNHYFGKDNVDDFGTIPVTAFVRYYPKSSGIYAGVDGGYSFVTNVSDLTGGIYINPHIGYHNHDWNVFGFYQRTFNDGSDIQSVGVGATYNLRFK